MQIIANDNVHAFDVDYTLVFPIVNIPEGASYANQDTVLIGLDKFLINRKIIQEMRIAKSRGQRVKLWSAGGYKWAECVAYALGITHLVDEVEAKPKWCWDDKEPSEWTVRCFRGFFDNKEDK